VLSGRDDGPVPCKGWEEDAYASGVVRDYTTRLEVKVDVKSKGKV
jgi:hypothetical protein